MWVDNVLTNWTEADSSFSSRAGVEKKQLQVVDWVVST